MRIPDTDQYVSLTVTVDAFIFSPEIFEFALRSKSLAREVMEKIYGPRFQDFPRPRQILCKASGVPCIPCRHVPVHSSGILYIFCSRRHYLTLKSTISQQADEISIATIRTLAADIIFKSNSGHPGSCIWFPGPSGPIRHSMCPTHQVPPWAWRPLPTFCSRGEIRLLIAILSVYLSYLNAMLVLSTQTRRVRNGLIVTDLFFQMGQYFVGIQILFD